MLFQGPFVKTLHTSGRVGRPSTSSGPIRQRDRVSLNDTAAVFDGGFEFRNTSTVSAHPSSGTVQVVTTQRSTPRVPPISGKITFLRVEVPCLQCEAT